jgi:hypothetical protein
MENVSPTLAVIELTGLSFCSPFKEVLLGSRPRSIQAISTGWIRCDKVQQAQYCVIRSVTTTFNDIDITPNSTLFEVDNQSLDNVGMLPAVKESAYKNNTEITSVKIRRMFAWMSSFLKNILRSDANLLQQTAYK